MRILLRPAAVAAALALCACHSEQPPPALAEANVWRDVPGMLCADGSPTGIGISPGAADKVLVYLAGGGACWSDSDCNSVRSFGQLEFEIGSRYYVAGTILDRMLPGNPFASWTIVFVPYCTGDVHAGDSVATHAGLPWNHHGFRNLEAAIARMAIDVARPAQVVVAGSSAGGFGALVAYDLVRAEWPPDGAASVAGALVDDSGPTFVGTAIPDTVRSAWWDAWNLGSTITSQCAGCQTDLSEYWTRLHTSFPNDRLALVSTTQDLVMRGFFGDPNGDFTGPVFDADLAELVAKLGLISSTNLAAFRVGGAASQDHALLASPMLSSYSSGDATPLLTWLSDMVAERSWGSKGP